MNRYEARCRATLVEMVLQACGQDDGTVDSYALTTYANAIRLLADWGYVRIETDVGRRVIARVIRDGVT